ncbi:MAG: glycosyltransferase [Alphaproteobacteria bacterium]|nr:glycosyltransferase [Alphaproteobacteria bacterium]
MLKIFFIAMMVTGLNPAPPLSNLGHNVQMIGPEPGLLTFPAPSYPEIRLEFFANARLKKIIADFVPDYIHIATEGPLGMAMRRVCIQQKRPYSTAYHTCFPEYLEKRVPWFLKKTIKLITYQWIKRLHVPSCAVMVSTPSIERVLRSHRISRIHRWSRGVDTSIFKPYGKDLQAFKNLPRPIYIYVGRVAVEKNLDAFLSLDLPGSKVVIGDGPGEADFKQRYPSVHFLGKRSGETLARHYAAADVFVFPSKTDTFGLVLLEAVACGLSVAAYPVQGPSDVFADSAKTAGFVVLNDDLHEAALKAAELKPAPELCYSFVTENYSWANCTKQFLDNLQAPTPYTLRRIRRFERAMDLLHNIHTHIKTLPKFYPVIYRGLSFLIAPLLPFYLQVRARKGKEDPYRLQERFGHASLPRPAGKLIWCHGASVGESLSLLPLIKRLHALPQKPSILVTTGTRSSAQLLAPRLPDGVIHQYIPVDTMDAQQRFISHWQPDLMLLTESELWPNMIGKIRRMRIPAALLNARMSEQSAKNWQNFAELWIKALLNVFNLVLAQSEGDAARFRALGSYQARSVGNLKAAAQALPYNEHDLDALKNSVGASPVWVMASTHEGDEELACRVHKKLLTTFPDLLTIIIPRHPSRAVVIMEQISQQNLNVQRRALGHLPQANTGIYLADTFGELGLFYKLSPLVCVGGSFGKTGGHNPLEPAHFGCAILFGPNMRNFSDIAAQIVHANAAKQLRDEDDLVTTLKNLLQNPAEQKILSDNAIAFAKQEQRVLDRVMVELQPLLNSALG